MKMSGRFLACLFVALAVAVSTASAQELRGRIDGAVTDNTGGVLPGVTVTVSGPAMIQPQVTVTGADGSYRFPALPTGAYTLVFDFDVSSANTLVIKYASADKLCAFVEGLIEGATAHYGEIVQIEHTRCRSYLVTAILQ